MNPWSPLMGLRREIWILGSATLINRAGTMVIPYLVLYLTQYLGFSPTRASLAMSVFGVGSLISGPLAGRLCDRLGSLRVMKWSLALSGLFLLPFPWVTHYGAILALVFLWSIIAEAFRPANLASLSHYAAPGQRRAAFALNRLAINLGMSVGPAAGGLLAAVSFPALFGVNGVTTLLSALVVACALRGDRPESKDAVGGGVAGVEIGLPALRNPHFLLFLAALIPAMLVFFQLMSTLPLFLVRNLGLPASSFGFLMTVNTVIIIVLEVPLNVAMSNWPHGRALSLGAILVGLGFGALAFAQGFWTCAATVVVWTFGEMILLPSSAACVADLSPESRRGEYMGYYQAAFSLALIAGPFLGTRVLERFGAETLWSTTLVLGCFSAVALYGVRVRGSDVLSGSSG